MDAHRRTSEIIAIARKRSAALKVIDPDLDLGGGLTLRGFDALIAATQASLDVCNHVQPEYADIALRNFDTAEQQLSLLVLRMMAAVRNKYGRRSQECQLMTGRHEDEEVFNPAMRPGHAADATMHP